MGSLGCLNSLQELTSPFIAFGVGSIVLVVLEQVPQYLKIIQGRSAEGLSAVTLGIGNVASALNVINLTILHANQVKLCFADAPASFIRCQPSFLVLYAGLSGFFACFPFYWLKLYYTKATNKRRTMTWGLFFQAIVILLTSLPAIFSILPSGSCTYYREYANTIGFANTVLLCSQFAPQIYTSCKFKGSGAISYATLGLDAFGGFIMVGYRIIGTSERLSSWLPYLIFHTSELVVILVAAYYDYFAKKKIFWHKHKGSLDSLPHVASVNSISASSNEGSPLLHP